MSLSNQNPITPDFIRLLLKEFQDGNRTLLSLDRVDENVLFMITAPEDGALEKTSPIAGTYHGPLKPTKELLDYRASFDGSIQQSVVDIIVQPPQATDTSASGARITKAVIELKETATLKKSGRSWENYASWVLHFDNETRKLVLCRMYMDSAAVNLAMQDVEQ